MFKFKNRTRKQNIILISLIALAIIAAIFVIKSKSKQNNLQAYLTSDVIGNWEQSTNTSSENVKVHTDSDLRFSLQIPESWTKSEKDNVTTYTHEKSSSYVKIEAVPYDPSINNVSANAISTDLVSKGYSFVSFNRFSTTAYQILYQEETGSVNDYIETYYWDRANIVKITCGFLDKDYNGIMPYFADIIGSFKWDTKNPIPNGYALYYNPGVDFEVGIPADWTVQITDAEVRVVNPKTSATIIMSVRGNADYLDKITASDITALVGNGKANFMMQNYQTSKTMTKAICSYTENNQRITSHQYIIANGKYFYFISFNYYAGTLDESVINTCMGLFREFASQKK